MSEPKEAMELSIGREETPDLCVLSPVGEINRHTSELLRAQLGELAEMGPRQTLVSFARVTLLDSAGIGVLISAKKAFRASGRYMLLRDVPDRIAEVLRLLRLYEMLVVDL